MRIITGTLKGRRLKAPDWPGLRPTSDKLRETLFNVLGARVTGATFVDGYAGTGAVGIEALSRGAGFVTFVEEDPRAAALIAANLRHCGVEERYAIIRVDFARARIDSGQGGIDIIFLDPPYGAADMARALDAAAASAGAGTLVVVEHAKRDAPPESRGRLALTRDLMSGDSGLAFYRVQELSRP